jgi:uncharacterized protein YjcR
MSINSDSLKSGNAGAAENAGVKPAGGAPKGNKSAQKHGVYSQVGKVSKRGKRSYDRRTREFKTMQQRRLAYYADRGGKEQFSAKELAIIEDLLEQQRIQDRGTAHVTLKPGVMFGNRGRSFTPIMRELQALSESITKKLTLLGLERVAPPVPNLTDYLASKKGGAQ